MKIILSAESTIDLSPELLTDYQIKTIPFTLLLGDEAKKDGEVLGEDLFAYTEKTGKLPKTSAINVQEYRDYFHKLLEEGDSILHFSLSSGITSATEHALQAAEEINKEGMKKVIVIDSLSLSTGIALQAIYARKLIDKGYPIEEIAEKVKARIPFDQTSFALESVETLYKGGRCSAVAKIAANILGLRPQIIMKEGKMISGKKFRGKMNKWTVDYTNATLEEFNNPDLEEVFITYSSADETVLEAVKKILEERGFKHIMITQAGGTICCHCGPHTLGVLYFNDGPHPLD